MVLTSVSCVVKPGPGLGGRIGGEGLLVLPIPRLFLDAGSASVRSGDGGELRWALELDGPGSSKS